MGREITQTYPVNLKTFTGYVLLRENTVCGIIMEV